MWESQHGTASKVWEQFEQVAHSGTGSPKVICKRCDAVLKHPDGLRLRPGSRGFSDFEVYQYVGNTRKRLLVVQCKKPGPGGLDPRSIPTVHGIVAIGQWVTFYEYDSTIYEMGSKAARLDQHQDHLVTDRRLIQGRPNSIRNNH
ncbi:hypothetical protein N7530_005538 [Penicillium desertorum]|uniref:Uncharacterized protein n=1 Tax=Penicillium desertorum TaxID=1303715 RepID=A0A9W9X0B9_9EURO|nr:hypothetical protein N7530_005538 [Penicillium desertorum]